MRASHGPAFRTAEVVRWRYVFLLFDQTSAKEIIFVREDECVLSNKNRMIIMQYRYAHCFPMFHFFWFPSLFPLIPGVLGAFWALKEKCLPFLKRKGNQVSNGKSCARNISGGFVFTGTSDMLLKNDWNQAPRMWCTGQWLKTSWVPSLWTSFETGKQHGGAVSRAPIFGLRLKCCEGKRRVQNLQKKGLEWACGPNTTKTSKEPERGVKRHPSKRGNSMVSRSHVQPFSASVRSAARANVASRTYKKKAWNELVGPSLFEVLRGQTSRPEPTKKRLGMSLWAQHHQDQQRARKGRQKASFETGKQHGVAGSRAPIFGLRLKCCEGKRRVQNLQKKGLEWACGPNTTKTSKESERGIKSHPSKRGNSMVSRAHVHPFSGSVWSAARANVASRTVQKKAWNELVGPPLPRPAKSQKGASKGILRNGETAWCRGLTCSHFRPPFEVLRGQTSRPEPSKKKAWNELVGPTLPRPAKSQKGASKGILRNGETAWCRGLTCSHFRPPFEVLRGQTSRPEPTKKRLGMSSWTSFETGKQHGFNSILASLKGLWVALKNGMLQLTFENQGFLHFFANMVLNMVY